MTRSGTEPGDFVEFDMDLLEAQRRQLVRSALETARPQLEAETGASLHLASEGNNLVLADDDGVRFVATLSGGGRVTLTDLRSSDLL